MKSLYQFFLSRTMSYEKTCEKPCTLFPCFICEEFFDFSVSPTKGQSGKNRNEKEMKTSEEKQMIKRKGAAAQLNIFSRRDSSPIARVLTTTLDLMRQILHRSYLSGMFVPLKLYSAV